MEGAAEPVEPRIEATTPWWRSMPGPVLGGAAIAFLGLVLVAAGTARVQAITTEPGGYVGDPPIEALYAPIVLGERLAGIGCFLGFAGFGARRRLALRWVDARALPPIERLRTVNWLLVTGGILALVAFLATAERDALFASVALQRHIEAEAVRAIYAYDLYGQLLLAGAFLLGFAGLALERR